MERGRIFGVALTPMLCAQNSAYAPGNSSIPQAIVAYGYLRWDYLELDRLLASIPKVGLASDLISLDKSLDSLHCDVPKRMAPPHKVLILPPFPITQWFGFERLVGGQNAILLKEFEDPGSGPFVHMRGRVFRLDLMSGAATFVSAGVPRKK